MYYGVFNAFIILAITNEGTLQLWLCNTYLYSQNNKVHVLIIMVYDLDDKRKTMKRNKKQVIMWKEAGKKNLKK